MIVLIYMFEVFPATKTARCVCIFVLLRTPACDTALIPTSFRVALLLVCKRHFVAPFFFVWRRRRGVLRLLLHLFQGPAQVHLSVKISPDYLAARAAYMTGQQVCEPSQHTYCTTHRPSALGGAPVLLLLLSFARICSSRFLSLRAASAARWSFSTAASYPAVSVDTRPSWAVLVT